MSGVSCLCALGHHATRLLRQVLPIVDVDESPLLLSQGDVVGVCKSTGVNQSGVVRGRHGFDLLGEATTPHELRQRRRGFLPLQVLLRLVYRVALRDEAVGALDQSRIRNAARLGNAAASIAHALALAA